MSIPSQSFLLSKLIPVLEKESPLISIDSSLGRSYQQCIDHYLLERCKPQHKNTRSSLVTSPKDSVFKEGKSRMNNLKCCNLISLID